MKKFLTAVLFAVLVMSVLPANAEPLEKMARKLASGMKDNKVAKAAVLDFQYHDGAASSGSSIVQERLTTYLADTGKVAVIERNLIKKLLEERKLELSGAIDSKTTKEIGKILGVPVVIIGTLNDLSAKETEVNARAVDTETGQILVAAKAEIDRTWTDDPVKQPVAVTPVSPVTPSDPGGKYLGKPLVQIAILLDTSNSMDGLINQARTQIWRIVNEFTASEQKGKSPEIQVALYEYGNMGLDKETGYIRRLTPFTMNLDTVSEMLFSLQTNGGDEYSGWVIKDAVDQLAWSPYADVYKVIFIAGNEPFTQGPVNFADSVRKAAAKGIFVNTIYCGDRQRGIAEQWKAGAELAGGDYSNIDQEYQVAYIAAPQDDEIAVLSAKLSGTQVPMGAGGQVRKEAKANIFSKTASAAPAAGLAMQSYQASEQGARADAEWDAVAAIASGEKGYADIKKEELPSDMQKMSDKDRKKKLEVMVSERKDIQKKITELSLARQKYISEQEKAAKNGPKTLEQAVLETVRKQGGAKGFRFKDK